jgi:putative transposase
VAAFIAAQRADYGVPVAVACRALGVSPAWFYKWRDGDVSRRRARRRALADLVATVFARHRGRYGSPRIAAELRELGWGVSVNTVAGLMAEQGLVARPKRRRKHTTRPGRGRWRAADRVRRDFTAERINQRWFGDGTEIPPTRASCSWPACWTSTPAGSSGSPWASTTTARWPTRRW